MKKAIVHKGMAHADDFLAIAFALALGIISRSTPVFRRDPTEEELDDPDVLVMDVGGRHEPEKNNFDHHQRHPKEKVECAMSLLLQHFRPDVHDVLREGTEWFETAVDLDCRGPFALAERHGCDAQLVFGLAGAVHAPIVHSLEHFGDDDPLDEFTMELLFRVGDSHIEYATELTRVTKHVKERAGVVEVNGVKALMFVEDERSPVLSAVLAKHRREVQGSERIGFAVLKDDRGPGCTLYRFEDDPRINFAKLEGHEEVAFAHPGGFIAKTHVNDAVGALDLAKLCIVPPSLCKQLPTDGKVCELCGVVHL